MINLIILLIIVVIFALAIGKIVKDKKNGVKCSGCPASKNCTSHSCSSEK